MYFFAQPLPILITMLWQLDYFVGTRILITVGKTIKSISKIKRKVFNKSESILNANYSKFTQKYFKFESRTLMFKI